MHYQRLYEQTISKASEKANAETQTQKSTIEFAELYSEGQLQMAQKLKEIEGLRKELESLQPYRVLFNFVA